MNYDELIKLESFLKSFKDVSSNSDVEVSNFSCKFNYDENDINKIVLQIRTFVSIVKSVNKIKSIVREKVKGDILNYFNDLDDDKYDSYFDSIFKIDYYKNYYVVWFKDAPYLNLDFVFDKEVNLLFEGEFVEILDEDNFLGISYFKNELMKKAIHYQYDGVKFNVVNYLDDVYDVECNERFCKCNFNDNLVICSCSDGYMLYDYKNRAKVIPSFSMIDADLENFDNVDKSKYMHVIKNIYRIIDYRSVMVSKLEYLVDGEGKVDLVGVYDFANKCLYSLNGKGNNQEEKLNTIYSDVSNKYKIKNRVRK